MADTGTGILDISRRHFDSYLKQRHKRRTAERFAILEGVMTYPTHFSIEDLRTALELKGMHVALATVYSTLELLVDCGLARKHQFGSGTATFEKVLGSPNHHHLVCTVCGKIKESSDSEIASMIRACKVPGFNASYYSLTIYGICAKCSRKARKSTKSHD